MRLWLSLQSLLMKCTVQARVQRIVVSPLSLDALGLSNEPHKDLPGFNNACRIALN